MGRLLGENLFFGTGQLGIQGAGNVLRDLLLDPKNVVEFTIEALRPKGPVVRRRYGLTTALMCTALPAFCTLPSSRFATPSC